MRDQFPRWLNMVVSGRNEVGVDAAYLSLMCRLGQHLSQKQWSALTASSSRMPIHWKCSSSSASRSFWRTAWPLSIEIRSTDEDKAAQKLTIKEEGVSYSCISNEIVHGS